MPEPRTTEKLAPGLYVVATPIGNLEDITLRALRVLRECDLIACEDTRHTQKLLNHFEIVTPTISYHGHNERERADELLGRLQRSQAVALVSDAGMPGISDPGAVLVKAAIEKQISVVPIPGPTAFVSALAASGLPTESFTFHGFLPAKEGQRRTALEALRDLEDTIVLYEAPHRISATLMDLAELFGPKRRVVLARELTKIHEQFHRGTAGELARELASQTLKGEMVLLIAPPQATDSPKIDAGRPSLAQRLMELISGQQLDEKAALKTVAREFDISRSEAYRELQRIKQRHG